MYRLVKGRALPATIRHLPMTINEGGDIGDFWIVTELEDGPPLGFGAPEIMTTTFGGLDAEARANNYLKLVTEQEDDIGI